MTEGERIRKVRKSLGLTLEKFGDVIGVSKVSIYNVENGNTNVTERMRKSICREFHVDYDWLSNGDSDDIVFTKEMDEIAEKEEYIDKIFENESPYARSIFKALAKFTPEDWSALEKLMDNVPKYMSEILSEKKNVDNVNNIPDDKE